MNKISQIVFIQMAQVIQHERFASNIPVTFLKGCDLFIKETIQE
jgi:hypothetical protein